MILPDVNVLIYAFRQDTPRHWICNSWLNAVVGGDSAFGISTLALAAVTRITTNSKIYRQPSTLDEAFRFCDFLLKQPHCQIVEPGDRHWGIFQFLCAQAQIKGPRVTDAWFAALAIEWGCEWITFDRDYGRFPGLIWRRPAATAATGRN